MRHAFNGNYGITRPFGVVDPAYSNYPNSAHPGTDYGLPANTPLVAGISGRVTVFNRASNLKTGRGKEVVITNGKYQRKFCHMNRIDVSDGQQVAEGQSIGLSGYTGYVLDGAGNIGTPAGAHLHDELLIDGVYVPLEEHLNDYVGDYVMTEEDAKQEYITTFHTIPTSRDQYAGMIGKYPRDVAKARRDEAPWRVQNHAITYYDQTKANLDSALAEIERLKKQGVSVDSAKIDKVIKETAEANEAAKALKG